MKNKSEVEKEIGLPIVESNLQSLLTSKLGYKGVKNSDHKIFNNQSIRKEVYQKNLNVLMMKSIDNLVSILDEDDAKEFIEMVREGKISPLGKKKMINYSFDYFTLENKNVA